MGQVHNPGKRRGPYVGQNHNVGGRRRQIRCRWIGRTHVFLGDELLDDRGNCIDSLLGRTRELQDGDEIEE